MHGHAQLGQNYIQIAWKLSKGSYEGPMTVSTPSFCEGTPSVNEPDLRFLLQFLAAVLMKMMAVRLGG